jgi:hypothetical protein
MEIKNLDIQVYQIIIKMDEGANSKDIIYEELTQLLQKEISVIIYNFDIGLDIKM